MYHMMITLAITCTSLFVFFYLFKKIFHRSFNTELPPGPIPIPIFGNIFELGEKPHQSFTNLSKIYGPLITLKLGTVTTIVISSSEVAKEMFLKHDHTLCNRTIPDSVKASNHDKLSMSWLPVSAKWRHYRKILAVELFSNQRLDSSQSLRQAKVQQLKDYVQECCTKGETVDIGKAAFTTSLSLLSNTFFSKELANHNSSASQEFKKLMWCIMEEIGRPNYADYFPVLAYIDPIGIRRRLRAYFDKLIAVFQDIIQERLSKENCTVVAAATNDVLDVLLNLYKQKELSMDEINHLLVDIFGAGTDTTASTLEWAMAELMKNPRKMAKTQFEIEQVLGKDSSMIKEFDIPKLDYLQAVIKETLRMHPPTVFLLPRKADIDITLCGYVVPKNAQVLVNLWAIGRDPKVWENADVFLPERFLASDIDIKGQDFELLPFGAGRRVCPGLNLAYRMMSLMLATLLQSYNWKLEKGMDSSNLDMNEKFGITLQKVEALKLIPIAK